MTDTTSETEIWSPREDLDAFRERGIVEQVLLVLITFIGVGLTAVTLYFAWGRPIVRAKFAVGFFGAGTALYYLTQALAVAEDPTDRSDATLVTDWLPDRAYRLVRIVDGVVCVAIAGAAAVASYHVFTSYARLDGPALISGFQNVDLYVGLVIVFLAIDATRRAYGWSIALVAVGSVLYAYFGDLMPGFLQHPGFSLEGVATYGAVRLTGAFGFIMEIGATWVAIFIMFAGLAREFGALDVILGLGQKLGENLRSGVVHVAVISSMAMGSITGSAAANAATTGSFTIPMMKEQGVRKDFAAAIESVASSGGQIMPPVMGVAAFLMADILGVAYVRVIQAAIIPALLFYFSVGVAVQFAVLRYGWTTENTDGPGILASLFSRSALLKSLYALVVVGAFYQARVILGFSLFAAAAAALASLVVARLLRAVVQNQRSTAADFASGVARFFDGTHFAIPMSVLIYTLVVMQLSPMAAGLYTTLTLIGTMVLGNPIATLARELGGLADESDASGSPSNVSLVAAIEQALYTFVGTGYRTLKGFRRGAIDMAPLVGVLAAMGVIISMLTQTGLTSEISVRMVALGGGVLLVVLILAMITSILFGLGMPTPAAYILVATLLVSPLTDLGVTEITAHLFVFYFAMLSAITPPVAVGVAVGSRIANSGFMTAAKQAMKIGAAGFLIPYALVVNDSLVNWTLTGTPVAVFCVFVGVVALTAVTIGFDGRHVLGIPHRAAYLALAMLAMYAPALGGFVGGSVTVLLQVTAAAVALVGLALVQLDRLPPAVTPAPRARDR
ncbi:TRAP transporter, 4TM/12TM fusion protein [Halorientalis persicus]|jgi:TRAP transporter 4TM/12TM fusion protein|uniref:TRAP transporter, 4TM/12TM fusion protein n=1 Tax=Halorientalis persicus TaxID=1367881 RepID=A0A1H8LVR2_9EURY|nr:TRAP transporter fused permease subunit [Halorientalis persicus]SEO09207.1 TRAP transporter, 4TM/12TM fusion protein [Halorientalis persicus]